MTATAESVPHGQPGLRSSALKGPMTLVSGGRRVIIDPDGGVRRLESLDEGRALYGFEQLWFYKVQAGIVVPGQRPDWEVRLSPTRARMSGRVFDLEVVQTVEFTPGRSQGLLRKLGVRNLTRGPVHLRVIEVVDVTAAHFTVGTGVWGSLGVNAFNRESHVALDEVSDPPSARVVGAHPAPSRFYLTNSRPRALEIVSSGEVPESTAGTSGQVLVISGHDLELLPGDQKEIAFTAIYDPGKLEDALAQFGQFSQGKVPKLESPAIACSDPLVAEAAGWALNTVQAGPYCGNSLDRYETLKALSAFHREEAAMVFAKAKGMVRKDGSLPHSQDASKPGTLETAVFLSALTTSLAQSQDKKLARSHYATIKKLAGFLKSKEIGAPLDASVAQGWRRRLGSGYPTGDVPEVDLAVSSALEGASQVAKLLAKADDAAKFMERAKLGTEHVRRRLLDERGFLSLCRDSRGRLRTDETIDMAVAAYRHRYNDSAEQATAHRLFEKDFDTPYGPRSVPSSNAVYFNSSYGEGQLGGVWTRATLAHAIAAYRVGLPGMGNLALAKVAKLVVEDMPRLGGAPGDFPHWVDPDKREAHGEGSDPVAAARLLEALLVGELGIQAGARASISPAQSSGVAWLMLLGFWAGDASSVFVGRAGGRARVFYSGSKLDSKSGGRFSRWARVESPQRGVSAVTFFDPGQVVCVGNANAAPAKFALNFPPRAADFTRRLSTPLEEYDPAKDAWTRTGSLRVSTSMSIECSLAAKGWKAYRVSTG